MTLPEISRITAFLTVDVTTIKPHRLEIAVSTISTAVTVLIAVLRWPWTPNVVAVSTAHFNVAVQLVNLDDVFYRKCRVDAGIGIEQMVKIAVGSACGNGNCRTWVRIPCRECAQTNISDAQLQIVSG